MSSPGGAAAGPVSLHWVMRHAVVSTDAAIEHELRIACAGIGVCVSVKEGVQGGVEGGVDV